MATATLVAWILTALAAAVALAFGFAWRAASQARDEREEEVGSLRQQVEDQRRDLDRRARNREERSRELGELRQKLEKVRKRAHQARSSTPSLEARIAELEALGQTHERERDEARRAAEQNRESLERALRECEGLRERLAKAQPSAAAAVDEEEQRRLVRRASAADASLTELTEKLRAAEQEASRYRSRERTHRRLYLVIKGELDVAKDRLAVLERQRDPSRSGGAEEPPTPSLPVAPSEETS